MAVPQARRLVPGGKCRRLGKIGAPEKPWNARSPCWARESTTQRRRIKFMAQENEDSEGVGGNPRSNPPNPPEPVMRSVSCPLPNSTPTGYWRLCDMTSIATEFLVANAPIRQLAVTSVHVGNNWKSTCYVLSKVSTLVLPGGSSPQSRAAKSGRDGEEKTAEKTERKPQTQRRIRGARQESRAVLPKLRSGAVRAQAAGPLRRKRKLTEGSRQSGHCRTARIAKDRAMKRGARSPRPAAGSPGHAKPHSSAAWNATESPSRVRAEAAAGTRRGFGVPNRLESEV